MYLKSSGASVLFMAMMTPELTRALR